jgi:hypothetical protein
MTQTVALIIPSSNGHRERIASLAEEFDFHLDWSPANLDPDVKGPLTKFVQQELPGADIITFHSTSTKEGAWFVQQELIELRMYGTEPKFFSFLRRLEDVLLNDSHPSFFVAADEWNSGDNILFLSGSILQLIQFLSITKTLDLPFREERSGNIVETSIYPLVFELI